MPATSQTLPGINDLFPDHLFDAAQSRHRRQPSLSPRAAPVPHPAPYPPTSPKARPRHARAPYPPSSAAYYPPMGYPHQPADPEDRSEAVGHSDDRDADSNSRDGKRHTCPHCGKRFNRPSSLKIHVNTHTGAKPFECPHPGCGRQFNVSSNMRRHYRNHSSASPTDTAFPTSPMVANPSFPDHPRQLHPSNTFASPSLASNNSFSSEEEDDVLKSPQSHARHHQATPSVATATPAVSSRGHPSTAYSFSPPYSASNGRGGLGPAVHAHHGQGQTLSRSAPVPYEFTPPMYSFPPPPPPSAMHPYGMPPAISVPGSAPRLESTRW